MGFSWQEYGSEFPCSPPEDLPDLGIKPLSLMFPALVGGFFTTSATWEAPVGKYQIKVIQIFSKFKSYEVFWLKPPTLMKSSLSILTTCKLWTITVMVYSFIHFFFFLVHSFKKYLLNTCCRLESIMLEKYFCGFCWYWSSKQMIYSTIRISTVVFLWTDWEHVPGLENWCLSWEKRLHTKTGRCENAMAESRAREVSRGQALS